MMVPVRTCRVGGWGACDRPPMKLTMPDKAFSIAPSLCLPPTSNPPTLSIPTKHGLVTGETCRVPSFMDQFVNEVQVKSLSSLEP
jgi:hypothetical protein